MADEVWSTWTRVVPFSGRTPRDCVAQAVGEQLSQPAVDEVTRRYVDAINAQLQPHGVRLVGDEFVGPAETTERADLNALVMSVDFWSIVTEVAEG